MGWGSRLLYRSTMLTGLKQKLVILEDFVCSMFEIRALSLKHFFQWCISSVEREQVLIHFIEMRQLDKRAFSPFYFDGRFADRLQRDS